VSNAHVPHIRRLYEPTFRAITVRRQSRVSADVDFRSEVLEYLLISRSP
jgi:hypothetical protein